MATERLGMKDLLESQSGVYTAINENMRLLEALAGGVIDKDLSIPPAIPTAGDVYIVSAGGTGDWLGHDAEIAHYFNGAWYFYTPVLNLLLYIADEKRNYRYDGAAWKIQPSIGGKLYKSITSDITLTADEAQNDIIEIYGTLSATTTITIPVYEKSWIINNATAGGFDLEIIAVGGSGTVIVPAGRRTIIYNDGTNVTSALDSFPYGIKIGGVIAPPLYDVASAPDPTANYGAVIGVTDGNAGALCLAVSDGGTWKRIALGLDISAT